MKMLLVCPPARDASALPLGAAYIAGYLRSQGHAIELLDLMAHRLTETELRERIRGFNQYDCIGISAIVTSYKFLKEFSDKIKSCFPSLPVIVGNAISVVCPELLLRHSGIDVVVADEGELTAAQLLAQIKQPESFSQIQGIWYKQDGRIYQTPPRPRIENLDALPYPAWDLFDMETYIKSSGAYLDWGRRAGWISAVRGCPFRCGYCSRPFGQKITARSPESIVEEILRLQRRYRIDYVFMVDDLFMTNKKFVSDFCLRLLEKKVKISWSCTGRVNMADEALFRLMKKAGCHGLAYGIESGSQKILNNMNKSATSEQAKNAIRLVRKSGLRVVDSPVMFGYVGEDRQTIRETIDFIQEMKLTNRRFFFSTPYPNTALYDWARQHGRIKYDDDAYLSMLGNNAETFLVNLTDFSDEELVRLKNETETYLIKHAPVSVKIYNLLHRAHFLNIRIRQLGIRRTLQKVASKIFVNNRSNV